MFSTFAYRDVAVSAALKRRSIAVSFNAGVQSKMTVIGTEMALPACLTAIPAPCPPYAPCTIAVMARYTLVYGVRLIPEGSLKGVEEGSLKLADGSTAGLTLHTFDGTIPQLRRSLDRSLEAFFDLLPGAEDEDVEKFGD
ncbi:MAG: hypothetical protein DMF96_29825 [Acidobacteria bacterium]|nr:MAG: hypothetical protein DMF96_29825 [Acidobacteriota bacterium]